MNEPQQPEGTGPLPRDRDAVDWWLNKWGRHVAVEGKEPLNREDVERLIEVNGATADEVYLFERDMHGITLDGLNLNGVILVSATLEGASFWGTKVRRSQLAFANLNSANLLMADLRDAYMDGADLTGAALVESDLRGTELSEANLQGADLTSARISSDTELDGVAWDKGYINKLEKDGVYDDAILVYRRLKEWYRGAGMLKIAGEFHYREEEAITKANRQRLGKEFAELVGKVAKVWQRLRKHRGLTKLTK